MRCHEVDVKILKGKTFAGKRAEMGIESQIPLDDSVEL